MTVGPSGCPLKSALAALQRLEMEPLLPARCALPSRFSGGNTLVDNSETSSTYAGFWVRMLASVIDSACVMVMAMPLQLLVYGKAYLFGASDGFLGVANIVIGWVLPAVAIIVFWRTRQATPGKMALKLRVVDAASGATLSTRQSIVRYLGYFIIILPFCVAVMLAMMNAMNPGFGGAMDAGVAWLVVLLAFAVSAVALAWIGLDPRKQGWHDKLARSVVIRVAG